MGFLSNAFSAVCSVFTPIRKAYETYSESITLGAAILGMFVPAIAFPMGIVCAFTTAADIVSEVYNIVKEYNLSSSWKQFANANTVTSALNIAQSTLEITIPFIKKSRTKVRATLQTIKTKLNATDFTLKLSQLYQNRDKFSLWDIPSIINGGMSVFKDAKLSVNMLSNMNNVQNNTRSKVNDQNTVAETENVKNEQNMNTSENFNDNTNKSKQTKEITRGNLTPLRNFQALNNLDTTVNQKVDKIISTPNQNLISMVIEKCTVCGLYDCPFQK